MCGRAPSGPGSTGGTAHVATRIEVTRDPARPIAIPWVVPRRSATDVVLLRLRAFGLAYPGAHTKSPWPGHLDLAVKDKTFAYLSLEGAPLRISCKLPHSSAAALLLPFTMPTAYGLGKSGWVSANFEADAALPVDMLESWIDESYRAQAPKRLIAERDRTLQAGATTPATSAKTSAKKVTKTVAKTQPKKVAKTSAKKPAKRR